MSDSPSALERHIANNVLAKLILGEDRYAKDDAAYVADALCADPTLRAIIDHAARFDWLGDVENPAEAEWRALLADWRTER